jgi:hypothetical protein
MFKVSLVRGTGVEVEHLKLMTFVEKFLRFPGSVEIDPDFAKCLQLGKGCGSAVDGDARRPGVGQGSAKDEHPTLFAWREFEGGKRGGDAAGVGKLQDTLDLAHIASLADEIFWGAITGKQVERTEENAFAGTGFASDNGEALAEIERGGIHQGEIFYPQ